MNTLIDNVEEQISLYHVCVKGHGDFTIYFDDTDFIAAVNYTALARLRSNVSVLAFCHMPNHSHFILGADGINSIKSFLYSFEQSYAMFFSMKHGGKNIFRRRGDSIKEIRDLVYLRHCIAYVLRNPLMAGLVKSSSGYPWTSQPCYFSTETMPRECRPISSLPIRQIKANIRTHLDLKNSGYYVDDRWMIAPKSFVDYKAVESTYGNSANSFTKYLGWVDDQKIEYDLIIKDIQKYDDIEMKDIANAISVDKYNRKCEQLLPEQKRDLARIICKKYRTSAAQLSRILRVRKDLFLSLFS